jgi:hypothetical protein
MTGTIEQLHTKVDAILAALQALGQPNVAAALHQVALQPAPAFVPPQVAPQPQFAPQAAPAAAGVVSAEMITALITPHVANEQIKAALQQQMAALGIAALPDAQPHQYGDLYSRFQQVIAAYTQQPQVQQPAAAPASII